MITRPGVLSFWPESNGTEWDSKKRTAWHRWPGKKVTASLTGVRIFPAPEYSVQSDTSEAKALELYWRFFKLPFFHLSTFLPIKCPVEVLIFTLFSFITSIHENKLKYLYIDMRKQGNQFSCYFLWKSSVSPIRLIN